MSLPVFNAKFSVKSSELVDGYVDRWEVLAQVNDMEALYYAHDIQVGYSVFLDTGAMAPDSGPVSEYRVVQLVSAHEPDFNDVRLILDYDDLGDPIDPGVSTFLSGFVCKVSGEGFAWMASAEAQLIPSRIVDYARNKDMTEQLERALGNKSAKSDFETEIHLITEAEETSKSFDLTYMPAYQSEVVVDIIGGVKVKYEDDFIITGKSFSWAGRGLDGLLAAGDEVRLTYIVF
jgi:hypothetical protein